MAEQEQIDALYPQLRKIAVGLLRKERAGHTWTPTALVHEAYIRALQALPATGEMDERRLCILAARAMRNALVDYARGRMAKKRTLAPPPAPGEPIRLDEVIHLHLILDELSELDPVAAEVVQLRYFLGYSLEDTARLVQRPEHVVKQEWNSARAWLLGRLRG